MTHKLYLVTGRRQYRWHKPGETFEALLEPMAEKRAIERGSIAVLAVIEPSLVAGSYELPKDWPLLAVDEPKARVAVGVSRA